MDRTRTKSMLASGATAGAELAVFAAVATTAAGPALAFARWLIGVAGAGLGFALNRRYAVEPTDEPKRRQGARYLACSVSAATLATGLFAVVMRGGGLDPRLVHVGSTLLVWRGYTFPVMKRWVFRRGATGS